MIAGERCIFHDDRYNVYQIKDKISNTVSTGMRKQTPWGVFITIQISHEQNETTSLNEDRNLNLIRGVSIHG